MMTEMRALTLWQPWATAVAHHGKSVENRGWAPPAWLLGQRFAIHAGRTMDRDAERWLVDEGPMPGGIAFPRGAIVAVVTLAGWVDARGEELRVVGPVDGALVLGSPWWQGPVDWVLDAIHPLAEPVPCQGHQGLWDVPPEGLLEVLRQVPSGAHAPS